MKNYLVIHGHFYQPPREDPWVGWTPYQKSAEPFHDWNERITHECYEPNSCSRIINERGTIVDIRNNYLRLSFNFGPTLLWWLRRHAPHVYRSVIEADRQSIELNNGHGNAIAQAYNHTILPLAPLDHIRTQIHWGIEDFRFHFGREPEGLWLPEAAVNDRVIDELIRRKIRFIVLSPWQAEAVCRIGGSTWHGLEGQPIPSNRAYRIDRPDGWIAVFFSNPQLSQGISFEHYLRDARFLYERISAFRDRNRESNLICSATDGEIFGHHERNGDMCFAALTAMPEVQDQFIITNFANYLEQYPPHELVRLKKGDQELGTSWSCSHGVSRWLRDCGCSTGGREGWNQQWRVPVREGYNRLAESIMQIYLREAGRISTLDPLELRNQYFSVLCGTESREDFARRVLRQDGPEQRGHLFRLLEAQRCSLFMFTSCGWFFAELSGLEPVQNMKYALRAIQLTGSLSPRDLLAPLLLSLEQAKSNLPEQGTGRTIMEREVIPAVKEMQYPAAVFILRAILGRENEEPSFGFFRLLEVDLEPQERIGRDPVHKGSVSIFDTCLLTRTTFSFRLVEDPRGEGISFFIRKQDEVEEQQMDFKRLPVEIRRHIASLLSRSVEKRCMTGNRDLFRDVRKAVVYSRDLDVSPSRVVTGTAELAIDCFLSQLFRRCGSFPSCRELEQLEEVMTFAHEHGLGFNRNTLKTAAGKMLNTQAGLISEHLECDLVRDICRLIELLRTSDADPDVRPLQNAVFELIRNHSDGFFRDIEEGRVSGLNRLKRLIRIGDVLGIDTEPLKERLLRI